MAPSDGASQPWINRFPFAWPSALGPPLKLDPGAKVAGVAIVRQDPSDSSRQVVLHLAEVTDRGQAIRNGRLRGPLDLEGFLLVAAIFPGRSIGKIELFKGFGPESNAIARLLRRHITPIADHDRIEKMVMQMIDIF